MEDSEMDRTLADWAATRSIVETGDPLWGLLTYRLARFAAELAKQDATALPEYRRELATQLITSATSIAANIAEGYSRSTVADRRRFYGYALGSAREAVAWYAALENAPLSSATVLDRVSILSRLRRLLFGMMKSAVTRRGGPLFEQ
jgi:four helix bundle protein